MGKVRFWSGDINTLVALVNPEKGGIPCIRNF